MATSNTKIGSDKIRIRLKAYDYVVLGLLLPFCTS